MRRPIRVHAASPSGPTGGRRTSPAVRDDLGQDVDGHLSTHADHAVEQRPKAALLDRILNPSDTEFQLGDERVIDVVRPLSEKDPTAAAIELTLTSYSKPTPA